MGKVIIFSAPSGSGKSTILNYLMEQEELKLRFSISATTRAPRGNEVHGKEYYFLTVDEFKQRIAQGDFLEYEEVYDGCFYGSLKSDVQRLLDRGYNVAFDVDVVGGINIKKQYGNQAMAVFIQPPSLDILRTRLEFRGTDTPEAIEKRLAKAAWEMEFLPQFDTKVISDSIESSRKNAYSLIKKFLDK